MVCHNGVGVVTARSWAQGEIAGVSLIHEGDPVRCDIVDGARTQARRFVNQRIGADGTVYTQGFDTEGKAAKFGIHFPNIPIDMFLNIITNINAAIDAGDSFDVNLQDDFHTLAVSCTVDGSEFLNYPAQRTNEQIIDDVTFRFIST